MSAIKFRSSTKPLLCLLSGHLRDQDRPSQSVKRHYALYKLNNRKNKELTEVVSVSQGVIACRKRVHRS